MAKGFNTSFYPYEKNPNSDHTKAEYRMYELVHSCGWKTPGTPDNEIECPAFDIEKGRIFTWPMDVFCWRMGKDGIEALDIEIDGESHAKRKGKDKGRDEDIQRFGIRVVRILKEEVVGKYAQPDEYLIKKAGL